MNYAPEVLRVNLTKGTCTREEIPRKVIMEYIGGRGVAAHYLFDEVPRGTDPLSSENKIIFSVGPLAGTGALSYSRWMITSKSPLTGAYIRAVGGADFGAWLRFAGLDGIILEGKASVPVYIFVEKDRCEIREAGDLWGQGTFDAQKKLKSMHGENIRVACIGPAGEKLVRYAHVVSDQRSASRGGNGAVMGSKNLKAIVIKANPSIPRIEGLTDLIKEQAESIQKSPMRAAFLRDGTHMNMVFVQKMGIFPAKNFREGTMKNWEKLSPAAYAAVKVSDTACYGCIVRCGKIFKAVEGPFAGAESEGPDYETTFAFAGSIATDDIGATIAADRLLDDLGMDSISAGVTLGLAYELFEKGLITSKDTGGLELRYGNAREAIELIKLIGNRHGIGDILAEGSKRAAIHFGHGAEKCAIHVKGMEMAGYDPRGAKRQGLAYATSNIGASHNPAFIEQEIYGLTRPHPVDRLADEGSADVVKLSQDRVSVNEVGIACSFTSGMASVRNFSQMLSTVTGIAEFGDPAYLFLVGERIYNLERLFNIREGFSRHDDTLPQRMLTEPLLNAGPSEGQIVRKQDSLLDEYYELRGWDRNGIPTPAKLKELGLSDKSV
ncbi:MAG: aldehyde ferredoxin oxidoreductase family protein [Dehalococcoidia bacterium]|nr:aldehyde ferredoxin oxidoreductase family protein [Dehalococcoidia bacterium]